jgi:alkylation response protein AidB-like acyl-CoA dehydrogenase
MWYMNEEREQLQKMARDFAVSEVRPFVKKMENEEAFPTEIIKKAGELGILSLLFPEHVGGVGPCWVDMGIVLEEIAKESNTVAMCLSSVYAGASMLAQIGSEEQVETILKPVIAGDAIIAGSQCEPTGIAQMEDFQTMVEFDGEDCILNGGKIFCTNAGQAKYYSVMARTKEPIPDMMGSITVVLVPADAPGFKVGHIENKLGWHGSSTGQIYFNNCRVPRKNILASFDMGFSDMLSGAFGIAVLLGAGQLGSAEGVYEKTMAYAKEKKHGDLPLFDSYQAMRHQLADLWMDIEEYRGFVYGVLDSLDREENVCAQAWAAKVKGARMFEHVASQCIVLNGGNGTVVENDIERYYRDAKMNSIGCFALPHITDMISTMI